MGVSYQPVICLGMFLCLTFCLRGEGSSGNSTCSNMLPFCVVVGVLLSIEFQQDMHHGFSIALTSKEFWNKTLQKNGHLFLVGIVQETDWLGRLLSPSTWWFQIFFNVHPRSIICKEELVLSIDLDPPETCESPQDLGVYSPLLWRVFFLDLPPPSSSGK